MQVQIQEIPRGFHTCAIVGNGPGVRQVQNGAVIDAHDAVFRFNAMRTALDAPFTGAPPIAEYIPASCAPIGQTRSIFPLAALLLGRQGAYSR
jgi:hypothetical protein